MEQIILTLPSGDINASGNAGDFTVYGVDLSLEQDGMYECALIDCSFPNPQTTATPLTCFIFLDFLDYGIVGSNRSQVLYRTQPLTSSQTSVKVYYEKETGTIQQWRNVQRKDINSVRVQIQTSTGVNVASLGPANTYSIVQVCLRRVR
jgi:hypothetical protein